MRKQNHNTKIVKSLYFTFAILIFLIYNTEKIYNIYSYSHVWLILSRFIIVPEVCVNGHG